MAFIDELKQKYRQGSMLLRLIYINVGIFLVLRLMALVAFFAGFNIDTAMAWLEMPSGIISFLHRPWTLITYAFTHYEILHILFNMLWLYWLGRIFLEYFTPKQLTGLYLLGAIGGGALYLAAFNLLPHPVGPEMHLLGASASVMAIVVAVSVYAPDYKIGLLFIGEISLKWVAIITVVLNLISIDGGNIGGHVAHLGGILVGAAFAWQIKRGHDLTAGINFVLDRIAGPFSRRKPHVGDPIGGKAFRGNPTEGNLDRVLAKIKRSGYSSLTDDERDVLFHFNKKQ